MYILSAPQEFTAYLTGYYKKKMEPKETPV